jgi:DNA-binding HxlR family transcriptional regulator
VEQDMAEERGREATDAGTRAVQGVGVSEDAGAQQAGYPLERMAQAKLARRPCPIEAALEIVGERWSLLAVREMSYGVHTFARIAGFTGAPRDILADRLRKLEASGVVERRQYSEHPPRYEYHLTEAGRDLLPVTLALWQWGNRWAVAEKSLDLEHSCGHRVKMAPVCVDCGEELRRADLTPIPLRTAERESTSRGAHAFHGAEAARPATAGE